MNNRFNPIADDSANSSVEFFKIVTQMSNQLSTGLTSEQISIVIELLKHGANAEQLAKLILNLRKQAERKQNDINNLFYE